MDTNIMALIIQAGSHIVSDFLRNHHTPRTEVTPESLEKFVEDSATHFVSYTQPPQVATMEINIPSQPVQSIPVISEPTPPITPGKASEIATGCVPCMPPDSLIWGNPGLKKISEVSLGQRVLDRDGKYTKILGVSSRPYNGDLIAITVPGQNTPILLTPNHKVLAIRGIKCRKQKANTLCFPKENIKCSCCSLVKYEPEFIEAGRLSTVGTRNSWTKHILLQPVIKEINDKLTLNVREGAAVYPKYVRNQVKETITIDDNFLKLAGLYLAEGSVVIQKRGALLRFDFGGTEQNLASETIDLLYKVFGVKGKIKQGASTLRVYVSSIILGHFFSNFFGSGASRKYIPLDILTLPSQKQAILLYGFWLGDGSWLTSYKRGVLSASTASANLAFGIRTILNRLGIIHHLGTRVTRESRIANRVIRGGVPHFTLQINSNGTSKLNTLWGISKEYRFVQSSQSGIDDNWVYLPIKKLERIHYEGQVLNLETESHTYCANGIVVSNCAMGHLGACTGILNESVRFAHSPDGLASPEVIDRIGMCMDELNAMERVDLRPEMIVQLQGWEKDLAERVLVESRGLRHKLENIKSVDELELAAAKTQTTRTEIGRSWFQNKMAGLSPEDKQEIRERVMAKIDELAMAEEE